MSLDGSQIFGKSDGLQRSIELKAAKANGLNVVTQRNRCEIFAGRKGTFFHRYRALDGKSMQAGAGKGKSADGSDAFWNGDLRQLGAIFKGTSADESNAFWNGDGANVAMKRVVFIITAGK